MSMRTQRLVPGVQNRSKPKLAVKLMLRVAPELQQGVGRAGKQQVVAERFVLQDKRLQLRGQGEDHMEVGQLQQIGLLLCQPCLSGLDLAVRAMPIAAGVVARLLVSAVATPVQVAAEGRSSTQGQQTQQLAHFQVRTVLFDEGIAVTADDLRHRRRRCGVHPTVSGVVEWIA